MIMLWGWRPERRERKHQSRSQAMFFVLLVTEESDSEEIPEVRIPALLTLKLDNKQKLDNLLKSFPNCILGDPSD